MRRWPWLAACVAIAVGTAFVAPIDLHDRDFSTFWLGARMVLEGRDPYDPVPWVAALRDIAPDLASIFPAGVAFPYPLWTALLAVPFALLPFDAAARAWIAVQALLALVALVFLLIQLDRRLRTPTFLVLLLLMAASQPWQALVQVGNLGGFMLAIVSGSLALLASGAPLVAGLVLGAAILKPQLVLIFGPAVLLIHRRVWRRIAAGAIATAGALLLASLLVRPTWIGEWSATIARLSTGLGARATAWGIDPAHPAVGAALVLLAVAVCVAWWRLARPDAIGLSAAALAVSVFAAPYAGNYDDIVLFAALAYALATLRRAARARSVVGLALVITVALPLPWLLDILTPGGRGEAVTALVPVAVLATVIACERLARATPLGPRVTIAVAAMLAAAAAVWLALIGFPARGYRDADFVGFWVAGRLLLQGRDPYDPVAFVDAHRGIASAAYELIPGTGFGYPLPAALLAAPFALFPIGVAAPLWLAAQILVAGAGLFALCARLFTETLRRDTPVVFTLVAASQPAWVLAASGNVGGFLLGVVAIAAALLMRGRPFAAGIALGLLIVKPHPFLLFVPIALVAVGRAGAIRVTAGGLVSSLSILLVSVVARPGWPAEWIANGGVLQQLDVRRANVWGLAPVEARWSSAIVALGCVALLAWWWRRRSPDLPRMLAVALPLSLFVAPYVWSYDDLVLGVSVAIAVAMVARWQARARMVVLITLAGLVVLVPWLLYALAFARGDEGHSAIVPLSVIALLVGIDLYEERARAVTARGANA